MSDAAAHRHDESMPEATIERRRRFSFTWLAPILALALVAFLLWDALAERGPTIRISFERGHEIKPEDPLAYRGVEVGRVVEVALDESLDSVVVTARLSPDAADLARQGSRFWIVRPEVSLTRVSGLETILGPRYIGVIPGEGPPSRVFEGLSGVPIDVERSPGGLTLLLRTERTGSMRAGSGVFYRDEAVGSVLSTRLSEDATHVDVVIEIEADFAHLVRDNSRFWDAGGIGMNLGLAGLRVQAESLEALVSGGVGFATPNNPGARVSDGHEFELASEPQDAWLGWSPELLPPRDEADSEEQGDRE